MLNVNDNFGLRSQLISQEIRSPIQLIDLRPQHIGMKRDNKYT